MQQHTFTATQGRYLAFIFLYIKLNRRSPAEADMQQYFGITAPAVHGMVLTLERQGLITREPGRARSIQLALPPGELPLLDFLLSPPSGGQTN